MIIRLLFLIAFLDISNAKKLTLDDAVLNSPFNIASMGWFTSFPNENSILISQKKEGEPIEENLIFKKIKDIKSLTRESSLVEYFYD